MGEIIIGAPVILCRCNTICALVVLFVTHLCLVSIPVLSPVPGEDAQPAPKVQLPSLPFLLFAVPHCTAMSGSPWPRAIVGGFVTIAVGYAIMKGTLPFVRQTSLLSLKKVPLLTSSRPLSRGFFLHRRFPFVVPLILNRQQPPRRRINSFTMYVCAPLLPFDPCRRTSMQSAAHVRTPLFGGVRYDANRRLLCYCSLCDSLSLAPLFNLNLSSPFDGTRSMPFVPS